jgi:DNA-binding response OmpR family regulator
MKILIVEDEPSLREIMRTYLERERYVVEIAATYSEATLKIALYDYDCILLDIMLPDGNGLDLLRSLDREGKRGNVIIISAKGDIEDKVLGLELGADDYLAKPFHLAELSARIRSLLRRKKFSGERFIEAGNVRIDPVAFGVTIAGTVVELSRKEYDILLYFVEREGRLVDKESLVENVWGDNIDQADSFDFVYAHIKNLRKKMREADADVEIKAVYGLGYKLVTL